MNKHYAVRLRGVVVGLLIADDEGNASFRFNDDYRMQVPRPVLSQSFEDDLWKAYSARRHRLPAFFANLVPEGQMKQIIARSVGIDEDDALAILEAAGRDMPGAVDIVAIAPTKGDEAEFEDDEEHHEPAGDEGVLRFSLAGVQMKFSVVRTEKKLTLPARDSLGEWIVKLDSPRFRNLPENEYATLEWARKAGFSVPECHLYPVASLNPPLQDFGIPGSNVFVIRRFDRTEGARIHQEDFAQVVGLQPERKYDQYTYEQCAALTREISGYDGYREFVRRLAFMIASGNVDAHLKNWSFIYPDGIHAELSPLYDQVCTIAWPELQTRTALKFAGTKDLLKLDEDAFARLAARAGGGVRDTVSIALRAIEEIADAWGNTNAREVMPVEHRRALREYWTRGPLLRKHSDKIQL